MTHPSIQCLTDALARFNLPLVADTEATGIGVLSKAANNREVSPCGFFTPEMCLSMAGRAGEPQGSPVAFPVRQSRFGLSPSIGVEDDGKHTVDRKHIMNTNSLVFQNTTFDIVDHNGDAWLRSPQIAVALGYSRADRVNELYARNADEFTADMTALVKLQTEGGEQEVRIFSPRGCYALAMFARTKTAKTFRIWVMDVLESIRKTGKYEAAPYVQNPTDKLTKEQADTLRDALTSAAKKRFNGDTKKEGVFIQQGWSKLKAHFKVSYRDIPQGEFTEAVSLLSRHVISGDYLQAPEAATVNAEISEESLNALALRELLRPGRRFLTVFGSIQNDIQPIMYGIPPEAHVLTPEEMIQHVGEHAGFPVALLPALITAAASRLQARLS